MTLKIFGRVDICVAIISAKEPSVVICFVLFYFLIIYAFPRLTGMPKEKYDPPDPRRCYTIMSAEDAANGKKSYWAELEISGQSHLLSFVMAVQSDAQQMLSCMFRL